MDQTYRKACGGTKKRKNFLPAKRFIDLPSTQCNIYASFLNKCNVARVIFTNLKLQPRHWKIDLKKLPTGNQVQKGRRWGRVGDTTQSRGRIKRQFKDIVNRKMLYFYFRRPKKEYILTVSTMFMLTNW